MKKQIGSMKKHRNVVYVLRERLESIKDGGMVNPKIRLAITNTLLAKLVIASLEEHLECEQEILMEHVSGGGEIIPGAEQRFVTTMKEMIEVIELLKTVTCVQTVVLEYDRGCWFEVTMEILLDSCDELRGKVQ